METSRFPQGSQVLLEALGAELRVVLSARRAALEFEREYASLDERERLGRELHELGRVEALLMDGGVPPAALALSLALAAAEELEGIGRALYQAMAHEGELDRAALLLTVSALLRVARLGEARLRAAATAARQGRRLEELDEALALAPEIELLLLALRRYGVLLSRKGPWDSRDVEQLFVRALSVPGRLRLEAAQLRFLAVKLEGRPLPAELQEAQAAFLPLKLDLAARLAWVEAGFTAEECVDWRAAGLGKPAQAHAWHCHGFAPEEAAAWAAADFLPDEAGIFVYCGVEHWNQALELRKALGSVEGLLKWKREGFEGPQVLQLLARGIRTPEQARVMLESSRASKQVSAEPPAGSALPLVVTLPAAGASPPPAWVGPRARRLGVELEEPQAVLRAVPPKGGAWLGWGAFEAGAAEGDAGGSETVLSLPLAGGLFDLVAESETVALPERPGRPAGLEPTANWQAQLDSWRRARGVSAVEGAWHLFAWPPAKALLYWGALFESEQPPWAEAVDFVPDELWLDRWRRKTEEWGEPGQASPCRVGRTPSGAWWLAFSETCLEAGVPGAAPRRVEPPWVKGAWRDAFEDFCLKMEIPRQAPHWYLVVPASQ